MTGPGWPSAREIMAFAVVALFGFAFVKNPNDQTIVGALIAAFAGAWGFYLGGLKVGSDTAVANAQTVTDTARTASSGPQPVEVINTPDRPVPTSEEK
ncbi:hypothetical protein AB5I41_31400 [Sphingomonas sp. MMS24-JH45]